MHLFGQCPDTNRAARTISTRRDTPPPFNVATITDALDEALA
jgi:hypothetical protein